MLTINIKGGTPKFDGKRLCDSCQHGMIMQEGNKLEIYCDLLGGRGAVNLSVTECTKYKNMKDKEEYEYNATAWILEIKNGKTIGFKPPKRRGDD